jgi:hypothetical protein
MGGILLYILDDFPCSFPGIMDHIATAIEPGEYSYYIDACRKILL